MSDEVVKPSAPLKSPSTSRRIWISVEPVFKEGTPESLIERSENGFPGSYGVKYALTIPGKEFYFGSADLSELVNSGESLVILTATRNVKLWDINPQVKEAHLKTDDKGKVTHAVLTINADNFDDAERKAHNFLMPFLSWLSYHGDVAVDVKACEICENNTETRHWTLNALGDTRHITWTPPSDLNITSINSKLRKLQAAYREGMNAVNPFYKFLCFWKVVEGCHAYRKQRERRLKRSSIVISPLPAERVPSVVAGSDIYLDEAEFFLAYLGEEFSEVRKTMKDILRNAIGHLTPGRVVLDPDDYDDVGRCEKAIPVIKYIARTTLANEIVADNGPVLGS